MSILGSSKDYSQKSKKYLRNLSRRKRNAKANRHLGRNLAFIAGAANAGGFLAVGEYTSHMTGVVSSAADNIALENYWQAALGMACIFTFMAGAAVCTLLVQWGRQRAHQSEYALPLLLEALLMTIFGVLGASAVSHSFLLVITILLLCFMMGLQNAVVTKISHAEIRTTHVTGLVTDIGISLGRGIYWWQHPVGDDKKKENQLKLGLYSSLVVLFFAGGILGAVGFKLYGYITCIPLTFMLVLLSIVPVYDDLTHGKK
jgi:uncharacterized membrane protein YoaK (UPF0700 family)